MNRFERVMLWGSAALVGGSGIVYGIFKYLLRAGDPYAVVNHPLQPLALKAHIVCAPLLVFAVGAAFTRHIWEQWRSGSRLGRTSGAGTFLMVLPMVLSGYLIQTATHDGWLRGAVVVHLTTGLAYVLGLTAHRLVTGIRERRSRGAPRSALHVVATGPGPDDRRPAATTRTRPLPRRRRNRSTASGGS